MSDNTFSVQRFRALPTEIHVMLVGTLLTRGAYFMVWPFLALLLWREFRLSASAIGLLLALATVCGALSGIYTGWLSDRFGRKRLIFFGTSLSGLSFVLLGFSGQPLSYGLAISGVSIGCALLESSCKALIGDRVEDRRSRELALYCRYFLDQPRRRPRPADRPDSRRRRPGRHLPGHRAGLLLLRSAALAPAAPPRT